MGLVFRLLDVVSLRLELPLRVFFFFFLRLRAHAFSYCDRAGLRLLTLVSLAFHLSTFLHTRLHKKRR